MFFSVCCYGGDFYAYYTKVKSGESWEKHSRTREHTDIVIRFDKNREFVFWRGSSYLPYWKTEKGKWYVEEVIKRRGDGSGIKPDKVNIYSHVRLIEANGARAIVHWRYVPKFDKPGWGGWVDEYFTVYPDGVCIRTIRRRAKKLDDWLRPSNLNIHKLRLLADGVTKLNCSWDCESALSLSVSSSGTYDYEGFDKSRRCSVLRCRRSGRPSKLDFALKRCGEKGINNPVVVVKNWGDAGVSVNVDGKVFRNYQAGYAHHMEGSDLVVWLEKSGAEQIRILILPVGGTVPKNKAPRVDAGDDQSKVGGPWGKAPPYWVQLDGSVCDDGLRESLKLSWSKVEGPGEVEFSDGDAAKTEVLLRPAGTYKLRLTASDGAKEDFDDVIVTVKKDVKPVVSPAAWWRFDEGTGYTTREKITGALCQIDGPKSLWKAGVLGTALQFDGYGSAVVLDKDKTPSVGDGLTLEAWIAIGAYPWNWAPIVHQSQWRDKGYYLGIDKSGHLGLKVSVGGKWEGVTSSSAIELYRWTHIAGTFDKASGKMLIFIDGSEVGSRSVAREKVSVAETDVLIGRNNRKIKPTDAVRPKATLPTLYGFDGLIDEVKIYGQALSGSEILGWYEKSKPSDLQRNEPAMQQRVLPSGPADVDRFGAYYTKLSYYETWDNLWRVSEHPDVVVKFDEAPVSVVFWRGTSYGAGWVTENNKWMSDQSVEEGGGGALGCAEHMSDKQCRHSHVRIIENTDARVVVHWRYAVVDILYQKPRLDSDTGWSDWVDEYYTIYPDGVGIRNIKYWSSDYGHYCFQDTQFLSGPGTRPEDNVEIDSLTVVNSRGQSRTLSWAGSIPKNTLRDANIEMVNLKSHYKPFLIFEEGAHIEPWGESEKNDYCPWPTWNHWPVSQILSDGRLATAGDRLRHSALGGVDIDDLDDDMAMYGLTNKSATSLVGLAKSWNHAPNMRVIGAGFSSEGYDRGQRAYVLRRTLKDAKLLRFTLEGTEDSPIVNPCFVIRNWASDTGAKIEINGVERKRGPDFRHGIVRDTDGKQMLVIWLKLASVKPTQIWLTPVGR